MGKFEPRNTFEHIDKLSYEIGPRLAGSDRSDQTAEYIEKKFEESGLETKTQTFEFLNRTNKLRTMMGALIGVFIVALLLNLYIRPIITFTIIIAGFGAAYFLPPKLLSKESEKNIIGTLKPEKNPKKRILIGAHYDSANCIKKWYLPGIFRIFLPIILIGFLTILIYPIFFGMGIWLESWLIVAGPYFFVCSIPFWAYESLVSPGAEDNASGVSVLLEVARVVSEADIEDFEIVFVAFGAEEQGLCGSKAYVENDVSADVFLNLDSLGSGDDVCLIGGNRVLRKYETSQELNENIREEVSVEEIWTPFSGHDHIPFLEEGVKSTTLSSTGESRGYRLEGFLETFFGLSNVRIHRLPQLHTIDDVPEEIKLENMESAGNVVLSFIGVSEEKENEN